MQGPTDSPPGSGSVAARRAPDLKSAFAIAAATWTVPPPPAMEVVLLDACDWRPWLADAHALLSAAEAERVQRRRQAADRDALAIAYAMHRLVLGKVLAREPSDVSLDRDERGCPRLAGDIAFTSLSHADGLVALAVTRSGPVGIDIELRRRAAVMPELARSVCHPREAADLARLDVCSRGAALLALWVRKEALLKAAGVGLAVPMTSFAAPEHPALLVPELFAVPVLLRMLAAGPSCVAAVAGATGGDVECRWLRPVSPAGATSVRAIESVTSASPGLVAGAGSVGRDGSPGAFESAGTTVPGLSYVEGLPACRSRAVGASP